MAKAPGDDASEAKMFGRTSRERKQDHELAFASLGPIVSGLILESYFEPEILSERGLRRILGRIFDALLAST
jgi:hypothetical protein